MLSNELLERTIKLKMPDRLPRAIDPEDLAQLLSLITHTRDRALILLLLRTGMRIGELLNCTVDEVDIRQQKIFIYQADKTAVGRVVYYSDDAQEALLAWLSVRDPLKEKLFYGQGRQSLCYEAARAMFNKYLDTAGLSHRGYTLHCLRHTFATDLLNARIIGDVVDYVELLYLSPLLSGSPFTVQGMLTILEQVLPRLVILGPLPYRHMIFSHFFRHSFTGQLLSCFSPYLFFDV